MGNISHATFAALISIPAVGCSTAGSTERPNGLHDLVVRAADYSFAARDTVPAGLTALRLENDGKEMHHVQLVRIGQGHTFEEFVTSAEGGNPLPDWVTPVGGPNASTPKDHAQIVVGLAPGQYAMLCFITSPGDRTPHYAKGMMRSLVVREAKGPEAQEPVADGHIILKDYSFTVTPALKSGRHTLRIENAATQPHEVVIARLAPGKTVNDLMDWLKDEDSPPPGEPAGGATALAPAAVNYLTADFAAGNYVLLCFVPDASDGRPHLAHGMLSEFRVD